MASKKEDTVEAAETAAPQTSRKAAWEAFLEKAEKQNPEKFAIKKANGEFDSIPDSFVG